MKKTISKDKCRREIYNQSITKIRTVYCNTDRPRGSLLIFTRIRINRAFKSWNNYTVHQWGSGGTERERERERDRETERQRNDIRKREKGKECKKVNGREKQSKRDT